MRTQTVLAVAVLVVLAGCAQAPGSAPRATTDASTTGSDPGTTLAAANESVHPPDPDGDPLGWENGYWYNETVVATQGDGLNDSELDAVVARSMARVEQIRRLEFETTVPVEIVSRSEFRSEQSNRSTPPTRQLFDNVKYESLFMINESTDSIDVQNSNSGSSVGGYYSPSDEKIVIVSNNESSPKLNEITLAQELFHGLQDQRFDLTSFNQSTRERHNAVDGIVEGDGNYVDYLYEQRCRNAWKGTCLMPEGGSGGGGQLANMGPYLIKYQPYSDGPAFVKDIRESGGWDAVDDVYEQPPASTEQVIHPEKYGEDAPAEFGIDSRTTDGWTRLKPKGRVNYGSVGEAGVMSMFVYPTYATQGQTQIVPVRQFLNTNENGQPRQFDPLNYNSTYSAGWDGDKLAVYTNPDTPRHETAYVWKLKWDSPADAEEFVAGYEKLLNYRGARSVDGRANTWTIPDDDAFGDAFHVSQQGDTVVVVNAPTTDALGNVRAAAAPK